MQLIPLTNEKSWRTGWLRADSIQLINGDKKSEEDFQKRFLDPGIFHKSHEIHFQEVSSLRHAESDTANELHLTVSGKDQKLEFKNPADLLTVVSQIRSQRQLQPQVKQVTGLRAAGTPLILAAMTAGLCYVVYKKAKLAELGETLVAGGSRRGKALDALTNWLAETLGVGGTLAVFGAGVAALLYWAYKSYTQPPNEVVYS